MKSWHRFCKDITTSTCFTLTLVVCLGIALFGGSLTVVFDLPDDPWITAWVDAIMIVVTVLFIAEIVLTSFADDGYLWSFFFWFDILGTLSMSFEISFILGNAVEDLSQNNNNASGADSTVLLRTARAAKVGARAGRLVKIIKCADFIFASRKKKEKDLSGQGSAQKLANSLLITLSTKVSLLTVILVLVVPIFQVGQMYPEDDLSLKGWADRLEDEYYRAYEANTTLGQADTVFQAAVSKFVTFYDGKAYFPYRLEGFDREFIVNGMQVIITGQSLMNGKEPNRERSVITVEVPSCRVMRPGCSGSTKAKLYYDFGEPRRVEAGTDIATIAFVIVVMMVSALDLNRTLNTVVVIPVEKILYAVRTMAAKILQQVQIMDTEAEDDGLEETKDEFKILDSVIQKMAKVANVYMQTNVVEEADMADMDDSAKGVIFDMMQMGKYTTGNAHVAQTGIDENTDQFEAREPVAQNLPVTKAVLEETWDFNPLEIENQGLVSTIEHIMFDTAIGDATGRIWTDVDTFRAFHADVMDGYLDRPYHNYIHACDVTQTVFRWLTETAWKQWISDVEVYALLLAALCHDVGHPGVTNPFLTETRDPLAMTYNDKSPLENMHCAKFYEICSKETTNVFKRFDNQAYKAARKVCVSCILHTDASLHFDMVKQVSSIYELHSEVCDAQAYSYAASPPKTRSTIQLNNQFKHEVLKKDPLLWLELFLHMSDISNPMKPFVICKAWAQRVLDEFFAQGDQEKSLGMPVGMLNDRDKVNRPGSQHGFINFLVAPCLLSAVKVFRILHPLAVQMANNLQAWADIWVEDAKPSQEEKDKRFADVKKLRDSVDELVVKVVEPSLSLSTGMRASRSTGRGSVLLSVD